MLEFLKKLMETLIAKNKVIAVGTTSVRTIESLYWIFVYLDSSKKPSDLFFSEISNNMQFIQKQNKSKVTLVSKYS